jgi:hypothetical protein
MKTRSAIIMNPAVQNAWNTNMIRQELTKERTIITGTARDGWSRLTRPLGSSDCKMAKMSPSSPLRLFSSELGSSICCFKLLSMSTKVAACPGRAVDSRDSWRFTDRTKRVPVQHKTTQQSMRQINITLTQVYRAMIESYDSTMI